MFTLAGYKIEEIIHKNKHTVIYRAIRLQDSQVVIIKANSDEIPSAQDERLIAHEFAIGKLLIHENIARYYALGRSEHRSAIVREYVDGDTLTKLIPPTGLPLNAFLTIAIKIVQALGAIHQQNIIYQAISVDNIIVSPTLQVVKLVDFSAATQLTSEIQLALLDKDIELDKLEYMAPEQTGRVNRSIDYRADFYSLGVVFYQMIYGHLPFTSSEPMEMLYFHIAKKPTFKTKQGIAPIVLEIIKKLLSKNAEDRYQSAYGLKEDLRKCINQLNENNAIYNFKLAEDDIPEKLIIQQKLYGREEEVRRIYSIFNEVKCGKTSTALLLVHGYPGVGKTALINEVQKQAFLAESIFISGKCEQYDHSTPNAAIIQASKKFIQLLLTESNNKIQEWKRRILAAIGSNGRILMGFMPELEIILGQQPPVAELSSIESQNRFHQVFLNFITAIAQPDSPLVIFLDDLQWISPSDLQLVKFIMLHPDTHNVFFMGAYRDNEVDKNHLLFRALEDINKLRMMHDISLMPLTLNSTSQIVSDVLYAKLDMVFPLAELVFEKTHGNPFFINQLLMSLYQTRQITFNNVNRKWEWNLDSIKSMNISDNVVDLMVSKSKLLPQHAQEVLSLAASIGFQFELKMLSVIYEHTLQDTAVALWPAVQMGLLLPINKSYYDVAEHCQEYQFLHDRVQQAAMSLIPVDNLKSLKLKIGRLLLQSMPNEQQRDNKLFYIVSQLNYGADLIDDEHERVALAELNLKLAKKAKDSTAYQMSLIHAKQGIAILSKRSWDKHYAVLFDLYKQLAECNCLSGNFLEAEAVYPTLLEKAKSVSDKISVFFIKMNQMELQGRYQDAIEIMRQGLILYDVYLPVNDEQLTSAIKDEVGQIHLNLKGKNIKEYLDAPEITDQRIITVMNLLYGLWTPCYTSGFHQLSIWASAKMVNLSLCHGNCEITSVAYTGFSVYAGALKDCCNDACGFGEAGIQLSNRYNNLSLRCKAYLMFGGGTCFWREPLKNSFDYLDKCYELGIESGNLVGSGYAVHFMIFYRYMQGIDLTYIYELSNNYLGFLKRTNTAMYDFTRALMQPINYLIDMPSNFDERQYLNRYAGMEVFEGGYYVGKIIAAYLSGDKANQLNYAEKALMIVPRGLQGLFEIVESTFYAALIYLDACAGAKPEEKALYFARVESIQKQMEAWMITCEANCSHKYFLIEAERARIQQPSKIDNVLRLYEQAIKAARDNNFSHHEALGYELCGKYWLERNSEEIAVIYLYKARQLYERWGAKAKVKQLDHSFLPLFLMRGAIVAPQDAQELDLTSTIRAAQAISTEINLKRLLDTIIQVIMENAGAQNGAFILNKENNLTIAVEYNDNETNHKEEKVEGAVKSIPLETWRGGAQSVVSYVYRTKQPVRLDMASSDPLFRKDDYIIQTQMKSILCIPVLKQKELEGILYLDNRLTKGAFTPRHIKILSILASQIAISLKNAELYASMESVTQRLHSALRTASMGTWIWTLSNNKIVWDEQLYTMYGVKRDDFTPSFEKFIALVHPDDRSKVQQSVKNALEKGTLHDLQLRIVRPNDKTIRTIVSRANAFRDENGLVQGMLGACCDITHIKVLEEERFQALQQVEEKGRQLELALMAGNVGTWTWSLSDNMVIADDRLLALFGLKQENQKLPFDNFMKAIHPDDRERVKQAINQTIVKGDPYVVEFRVAKTEGNVERILEGRADVFRDPSRHTVKMMGVTWDITQRKRLEEERYAALKKAEEYERKRAEEADRHRKENQDITDMVYHEMRNPLTGIYGCANELNEIAVAMNKCLQLNPNAELAQLLKKLEVATQTIELCAKHQKDVIESSLNLSKVESGNIVLFNTPFQPCAVIDEALRMLRNQADKKGLELNVPMPLPPIMVKGDPEQFNSVVMNLISNAIKYTDKGRIIIILKAEPSAAGKVSLTFSVEDTGRGIPKQRISQLFHRFFRVPSSQYDQGVGLGLSITKRIIDLMGGAIGVESEEGKGSKFTVHLILQGVAVEEKIEPAKRSLPQESIQLISPSVLKKILVVEDNLVNQKILQRQIINMGYECIVANNGREAVDKCREADCDLIFMDKEMPVMDGIEATKCIRNELKKNMPIIGLSAYARSEHISEAMAVGMNAYLTKPYEINKIKETIQKWTTSKPERHEPADVPASNVHPSFSFWKGIGYEALPMQRIMMPAAQRNLVVLPFNMLTTEFESLGICILSPGPEFKDISPKSNWELYSLAEKEDYLAVINIKQENDADKIIEIIDQSKSQFYAKKIAKPAGFAVAVTFSQKLSLQTEVDKISAFIKLTHGQCKGFPALTTT